MFGKNKEGQLSYEQLSVEVRQFHKLESSLDKIARKRGVRVPPDWRVSDPRLGNIIELSREENEREAIKEWVKKEPLRTERLRAWQYHLGPVTVKATMAVLEAPVQSKRDIVPDFSLDLFPTQTRGMWHRFTTWLKRL